LDKGEREERQALAAALRQSADGYLSEQALRDALSRSYYSVFHLGCILLGKGYGSHDEFLRDLQSQLGASDDLWEKVKRLQELRIQADYRFDALRRIHGGDPERFQRAAFDGLALGRDVFKQLLERITRGYEHASGNGRED
jgi:uncharacterized protein (UPF0332 family)